MKLTVMNLHRTAPEAGPPTGRPPAPSTHAPEAPVPETSLRDLRQRILDLILIVAVVLGAIVYITNLTLLAQSKEWLVIGIYSLVFLSLLVITFRRSLPYSLRASLLLLFLYTIGILALVDDGLYGSGRVFLLAIPFIAAILMGLRGGIISLLLSIAAILVTGLLMSSGTIPAPTLRPGAGNDSLLSWLIASANFALLVVTGVISLGVLVQNLENSLNQQRSLTRQVERARGQLEERVRQRTADLERRLVQIRTAAEIAFAIGQMTDIDVFLPQVCELLRERFNLYYVGVFLIDVPTHEDHPSAQSPANSPAMHLSQRGEAPTGPYGTRQYALLAAGTGEAGKQMLAEGHRLLVGGDSMIGWATANRRPRIALDIGQEAVRFNNPYLPLTRSEMALPILTHAGPSDQVLGALTIQSELEAAFDQDDILVLQGIADVLASAMLNARLLATTRANLEEISSLHRQYLEQAWADTVQLYEARSQALAYSWQASAGAPGGEITDEASGNNSCVEIPIRLRDEVIGNLTLEFDRDLSAEAQSLNPSSSTPGNETGERIAQPYTLPAELIPVIEAVMNQAALTLENARLLEDTRLRADQERIAARVSGRVWSSSNVRTILRATLEEVGRSLGARHGSIELWSESKDVPTTMHSSSEGEDA
jgi:GAF domain-containing protein